LHKKSKTEDQKIHNQIIELCTQIAPSTKIIAINKIHNLEFNKKNSNIAIEAVLILKDFKQRIMSTVRFVEGRNISISTVDQWIFERDVDRGFLGEAFASSLVVPYTAILGRTFLHNQELILKKRLILELLENLIQNYPELATQLKIKPEYFMFEVLLERVRLFPPLFYSLSNFLTKSSPSNEVENVLKVYNEALFELKKDNQIDFEKNIVSLKQDFINKSKNPKIYINNLRKKAPRSIFTSVFSIWSQLLSIFSQKTRILASFKKLGPNLDPRKELVNPQEFVLISTNEKVFSLADGIDMITFAKKHFLVEDKKNLKFEVIGGILNDVYLITSLSVDKEKKIVVKRYRDWSGFKWFPLSLWSLGVRNISVIGRSRLAKECEINNFLGDNSFNVPKIFHVSHKNRLIFMDYIEGNDLSLLIKKFTKSKRTQKNSVILSTIKKVGKLFAKIHSMNVTLGDTKPENIIIDPADRIFFLDFEQASFGGDKSWDLAVFLYFLGHYISPFCDKTLVLSLVNSFLSGYLKNGGDVGDVRKAGSSKYTRIFSILILPYFLILISNTCKNVNSKIVSS
jgi:tRNA A-37 threonylcarbamoyl transferase component Bud32